MHLYFRKVRKKKKKSPTAAASRSPLGLLGGRPHFTAGRGAARRCWSCSPPWRPSPAGSCSPATELLVGRAERLTRRGAPRQPRGAARHCSPPGGPARRRVELLAPRGLAPMAGSCVELLAGPAAPATRIRSPLLAAEWTRLPPGRVARPTGASSHGRLPRGAAVTN